MEGTENETWMQVCLTTTCLTIVLKNLSGDVENSAANPQGRRDNSTTRLGWQDIIGVDIEA